MNERLIARVLGMVLLFLSVALLVYFLVAFFGLEAPPPRKWLGVIAFGVTFCVGLAMFLLGRRNLSAMSAKDAVLVVIGAWFFMVLVGAVPYLMHGGRWAEAIFESASGFSTTGASVFPEVASLPPSLLFWRAITQWIGGLGIIVFFVALIPALGVAGRMLFRSEVPGPVKDGFTPNIKDTTRFLWLIYVSLTGLAIFFFWLFGMSFFDAVAHAFTVTSTGGFSTQNDSLAGFNAAIQWTALVFMLLGGINFALYVLFFSPLRGSLLKDTELRWYLAFIFTLGLIFSSSFYFLDSFPFEQALRTGFFLVVSMVTTTGYANYDYELLPLFLQGLLLITFLTGGSAGSTAGGVKFYRVVLIFHAISGEIKKSLRPRLVSSVKIAGHRVEEALLGRVFIFISVYFISLLATSILLFVDGIDFLTAFTAAASSLGNIGPGYGEIGPTETFQSFSDYAKYVCAFAMVLGRLEFFTLLAILHPSFWSED